MLHIINWIDNVNWPPLQVSKLTFWSLALCQSEWHRANGQFMLPTQLIILNYPAAYTVLLTVSLTTSCLCGLNQLRLTLHILIYSAAHYISSGTDMDHFLTIKRFLMLVIIFFILMTSMLDLGEILKGDSGWVLMKIYFDVSYENWVLYQW